MRGFAIAALAAAFTMSAGTAKAEPPVEQAGPAAGLQSLGSVFRDCPDVCPDMVVIAPGEFAMGSPPSEPGRFDSESPQHRVVIGHALAVGRYDVTRGEYAAFVRATGYRPAATGCFDIDASGVAARKNAAADWRRPGFDQTDRDPVVCVNLDDVGAYLAWLSRRTGHAYRLLSEAEYEYAERGGTTRAFWWGDDAASACRFANGADLDAKASAVWAAMFPDWTATGCHDGYVFTSPVGGFGPNGFGLYDMAGDVWSWMADCWTDSYADAPTDGSANLAGDCGRRSLRGGSWKYDARMLRSANRDRITTSTRLIDVGFRVARML